MKKIILSSICASLLTLSVQADIIGAEAGVSMWSASTSGSYKGSKLGDTTIDVSNDLGYGSKSTNNFFWVYIDHPVPLLPNIKIQQTNFTDNSSKLLNKTIKFDNKTYTANSNIKSELTLNQTDIIAYWRILDNWVNFDLGLNLKSIDGNVKIEDTNAQNNTNKSFKATVPMLYIKARFDLPLSGLSIEADASTISYSGNKFTDVKAGLVYQTSFGLGANIGIRNEQILIDNIDNFNSDLKISGAYLGMFYHF